MHNSLTAGGKRELKIDNLSKTKRRDHEEVNIIVQLRRRRDSSRGRSLRRHRPAEIGFGEQVTVNTLESAIIYLLIAATN